MLSARYCVVCLFTFYAFLFNIEELPFVPNRNDIASMCNIEELPFVPNLNDIATLLYQQETRAVFYLNIYLDRGFSTN